MSEPNVSTILNHLIESCRDAAKGFQAAADLVSDRDAKALFTDNSAQRAGFAAALLPYAQRLGGATAASGTAGAAMHRQWMDLRDTLSDHDDRATLTEVLRGDRVTVLAYKTAVESVLPLTVRDLVEKQYAELSAAHIGITDLDKQWTQGGV